MIISSGTVGHITGTLEQLIRSTPLPSSPVTSDFYAFSYPHLVSAFARVTQDRSWTLESVVVHLCSMYAWMPRGVTSYSEPALETLAHLLNTGGSPEGLISVARRCFNNSMVAGSKFLHIYDTELFPMSDSNTESGLWSKPSGGISARAERRYLEYREGVLAVSPECRELAKRWALHYYGYETTATRAIEALLFQTVRRQRRPSSGYPAYSRGVTHYVVTPPSPAL